VNDSLPWFATCPKGLEELLAGELVRLGAAQASVTVAGCSFRGPLAAGYRACLWSRLANRILLQLDEAPVTDARQLHDLVNRQEWRRWLRPGGSLFVDFHGNSPEIRNTRFGAQVVKDAIVDYCREAGMPRPEVARERPDLRVQLRLHRGAAVVSVDFSGHSLHRRGFRESGGRAPLKENLAAAVLLRADWPGMAARGGALIDPMCGSATLLLEGAMMAADIAPGLGCEHWGFEGLPCHNPQQWRALLSDARSREERGRRSQLPEIRGYDADVAAIRQAESNVERAGLQSLVRLSRKSLADLKKPTHRALPEGLLVCNPPYGERIGDAAGLPYLYNQLGAVMAREFGSWQAAVLAPDKSLGRAIGLRSHKQYALYNGALPVQLLLFSLDESNRWRDNSAQPASEVADTATVDVPLEGGAAMFANRLRKNQKRLQRWAEREQISCYRLYDADMPEYAVAIDRYDGALHVAEYRAPRGVDPQAAARRLAEVKQVLPQVTGVSPGSIYYKTRERQRGKSQYGRTGSGQELFAVQEGGVKLLVNLADYLDTGLFLDHRPLRLRIASEARGKSLLNLFCYTASVSVHAAAAGARYTTSVDLSRTYLDWARKNFAVNGLDESRNRLEQADCLEWLARDEQRYDIIVLDPPSFSNSKRMRQTFDVQRDHLALLSAAVKRLSPEGVLYFSCNLRKFRLDPAVDDFCQAADITTETIDLDFKRRPSVHHCWRITAS
jgi:23S rRNA (guanine2445-N2)-methyltransferase / 23S rRNA (guanine2069-N7)-methyltransferase